MLAKLYNAEIYTFDQKVERRAIGLAALADLIRDGGAVAALVDVVEPDQLSLWWDDPAYPAVTQHQSFPGAGKSGLAIGPTQRLVKEQLIPGLIDYFSYGARCNDALRQTEFVRFCAREFGAGPVRVGDWGELPLVSKREYQPIAGGTYSVPPHCDAIHFGREPQNWPIKQDYSGVHDQISVFLSVQDADNGAGLVLWNYRPQSRAELDGLMAEHAGSGQIACLAQVEKVVIRGRPGQLNVLNTRVMHAVEQCQGVRQTLGSFIIWNDGQWRMFH